MVNPKDVSAGQGEEDNREANNCGRIKRPIAPLDGCDKNDSFAAGSTLQIEPKRFDSGYKPEPAKEEELNESVATLKLVKTE